MPGGDAVSMHEADATKRTWLLTSLQKQADPTNAALDLENRRAEENTKRAKVIIDQVLQADGDPRTAWNALFAEQTVGGVVLAEALYQLHDQKQYEAAIEGIEAALRHDHGQPWMYDLLALEMTLAKRPQQQIDRVLLSRVDFTGGDQTQLLITASMMARFEAFDQAIAICRECAKRSPFDPAVWGLARRVADRSNDPEAIIWAQTGTIRNVWTDRYETLHKECEIVLNDLVQTLAAKGQSELADSARRALSAATSRDLLIRMTWAGDADLDLIVYEPNQQRCSYKSRLTSNGGALVRQSDGGKAAARSGLQTEEYILSEAPKGDYRVLSRYISGRVISGRVRLEVVRYLGTDQEDRKTLNLPIGDDDPQFKVSISRGRGSLTQ